MQYGLAIIKFDSLYLIVDVLVVPQRVVPRLSDLTGEEIADVFQAAQTVGRVVEKAFAGESITIACQVYHAYFFAARGQTSILPLGRSGRWADRSPCACAYYTSKICRLWWKQRPGMTGSINRLTFSS